MRRRFGRKRYGRVLCKAVELELKSVRIDTGRAKPDSHSPVVNSKPSDRRIKPNAVPGEERRWVFSFRYWKQFQYFGLNRSTPEWFVSLFDKLQELSTRGVDSFRKNSGEMDVWRYHAVNWEQTNIPIKRSDLNWIDKTYLDNEEDYPIYIFQISTSLGRIAGFWDEHQQFNIVLFDPLHNLQPAKSFGYKVDACDALSCDYTLLLNQVDEITKKCGSEGCKHSTKLHEIRNKRKELESFDILMIRFENKDSISKVNQLITDKIVDSHCQIFDYGLQYLDEQLKS